MLKKERNNEEVAIKLQLIKDACKTEDNLLPLILEDATSYATLGEIVDSMKDVCGEWSENPVI